MPFRGSLQEKEGKGQYEVPTYQHQARFIHYLI